MSTEEWHSIIKTNPMAMPNSMQQMPEGDNGNLGVHK